MAKVFDIPRYRGQTKNKLVSYLSLAADFGEPMAPRVFEWYQQNETSDSLTSGEALRAGMIELDIEALNDPILEDELGEGVGLLRQAYEDGLKSGGLSRNPKLTSYGIAIAGCLGKALNGSQRVLCDDEAAFEFVHMYLSGNVECTASTRAVQYDSRSAAMAVDAAIAGAMACNHGNNVKDVFQRRIRFPGQTNGIALRFHKWHTAIEKLKLSSMSPAMKSAHAEIELTCREIHMFSAEGTYAGRHLQCQSLYRVGPFFFIGYPDVVLVFDHAAVSQLLDCSTFWDGVAHYCTNWRASAPDTSDPAMMTNALTKCVSWMSRCLAEMPAEEQPALPRLMKIGQHRFQNRFHADHVTINTGWEERDAALREAGRTVLNSDWCDCLESTRLPGRMAMDLANLYHGLPAPDCDLSALYAKSREKLTSPNPYDATFADEFLRYCKAADLARAIVKYRERVKTGSVSTYHMRDQTWYRKCMRGILVLPPREDWGKAWVENFFEVNFTTSAWFWEAGDVTRVEPSHSTYSSVTGCAALPREYHNELLYALKHAPQIAEGFEPADVDRRISSGCADWDKPVVLAAKSENTKFGRKVRATWSADAITREATSQYDRCAIPLAALYRGITSRKRPEACDALMSDINADVRSNRPTLIVSNDAAGWSDTGPRRLWAQHHDYVLRTTTAPKGIKLENIWDNMVAYMNKRGDVRHFPATETLFQGFTGTMDSLLNDRLSLYCVRVAKEKHLLREHEGARTAAMIDDAVQALVFDSDTTDDRLQTIVDQHYDTTFTVWANVGAELDKHKTMYSTHSFIYLNRFNCEGSEVLTPAKIFAKADRDFTRRYASILDHTDTVLGAYRSAAGRGADPLVCYAYAIFRVCHLCVQTASQFGLAGATRTVATLFAPRGMGGLGLPSLTGFLTNEIHDGITSFLNIMYTLSDRQQRDCDRRTTQGITRAVAMQPFAKGKYESLASRPREVYMHGVVDPGTPVRSFLQSKLASYTESPVFSEMLAAPPAENAFFEELVKLGVWDANVLESFTAALPNRVRAALLDRAGRSEILVRVTSFKDRARLSDRLKEGNATFVLHISQIPLARVVTPEANLRAQVYDDASWIRDQYYQELDARVVNHTVPDYAGCWAPQPSEGTSVATVSYLAPTSKCYETGNPSVYKNVYDGIPPMGVKRAVRSKSAKITDHETYKTMNIVQKTVAEGAAVVAYVRSKSDPGDYSPDELWAAFCAAWGVGSLDMIPDLGLRYRVDASTKRIGIRNSRTSHLLLPMPNSRDLVQVNASRLARYLDSISTPLDLYAMIDCLRCMGIVEYAAAPHKPAPMHFAIHADCLPTTDPATFVSHGNRGLVTLLQACSGREAIYRNISSTWVPLALASPLEDDEALEMWVGTRRTLPDALDEPEVIISAGQLFGNAIGLPVPVRQRPDKRAQADEYGSRKSTKLSTRISRYTRDHGTSQAALMAIVEQCSSELPRECPREVYTCRWHEATAVVGHCMPNAINVVSRALKAVAKHIPNIPYSYAQDALGGRPSGAVEAFRTMGKTSRDNLADFTATMVLFSYGRACSEAMYSATASLGGPAMRRSWRFAAKRCRLLSQYTGSPRYVMSHIYTQLALQVAPQRTFRDLIRSLVSAFDKALTLAGDGNTDRGHLPAATIDDLTKEPEKRVYRQVVHQACHRAGAGSAAAEVCGVWDQSVTDCLAMMSRTAAPPCPAVREVNVPTQPMDIPGSDEVVFEMADESGAAALEPWQAAMTAAVLDGDLGLAKQIYTTREFEPTDIEFTADEFAIALDEVEGLCSDDVGHSDEIM